jgi:hypothetical protein
MTFARLAAGMSAPVGAGTLAAIGCTDFRRSSPQGS